MQKGSQQQVEIITEAEFSSSRSQAENSLNKRVMAGVIKQIANENNELAVTLRDKGKIKQAQKVLRDNTSYLRGQAGRVGAYGAPLKSLAEENEKDANNLDSGNWSASRKAMKARQHKLKTQQAY